MKAFIVYAHPEPKSFNGALYETAVSTLENDGWDVRTSDLYAMNYNPVSDRRNFTITKDPDYLKLQIEEMHASDANGFAPDVETEIAKMEWCDLMIWQCPLWWFGVPAILKGWADRTLAMGRTYGGGRFYNNGVYQGKRALLSMTTGGGPDAYAKGGFNGDINAILRPVQRGIFAFVGFDVLAPALHWGPVRQDDETRATMLADRRIAAGRFNPRMVSRYCGDPCFRVVAREILGRADITGAERRRLIHEFSAEEAERGHTLVFAQPDGSVQIHVDGKSIRRLSNPSATAPDPEEN